MYNGKAQGQERVSKNTTIEGIFLQRFSTQTHEN